jgi:hypothetical protein
VLTYLAHSSESSDQVKSCYNGYKIPLFYVTPPKLALANPVESLAIYPFKPTCDQKGNHPYKIVRVNVKECE